ncbi:phosphate butyryltransferase [Paludibacter propionicigenes WB4]|uniref:Phosphate butyryltransferase n=1 Tax=Paludibacter propionicigenes (strain DSM 17365 / JCM 13257 / WB4) TaxID=694427 RepID=E4T8P9_PALPW|nr:phosphate acyltransferase [Paludibacter propionicigenes]ADQ81158.1 phosphate butyryltransferase [Paludibacter propionicigenes WB4]
MELITSFAELTSHLKNINQRKRLAVANAVDSHTLDAVLKAVDMGIVEAFLIGDVASIESPHLFEEHNLSPFIHIIDIPEVQLATLEAVRMVKAGEADILMKGLVNTDVLLRAILDKEKGILPAGNVLTFNAALQIPNYHKLIFFSDPVVIPSPNLVQRIAMIKYAIKTAYKFGISKPKVALIHATEVANPKIHYMQDYLDIMQMWREGEFGNVIMDGPLDIFLALDKERGSIKNVPSPVLGDADILIFPNFECANCFYKGLSLFAGAEMGGLLQGTEKPVVLTSRSESVQSKFYSIAMACVIS